MSKSPIIALLALSLFACADRLEPVVPVEVATIELDPGPVIEDTAVQTELAPQVAQVAFLEPTESYTLRRGETLAHFARWSDLPIEIIAETSGLDLSGAYPVGTVVMVPIGGEEVAKVERRRTAHHGKRVDSYLASRGGSVRSEFVTIQTGDTAWRVAREANGIPVWLIEAYNPAHDLDNLHPGQTLMVPVFADTVVSADGPGAD